MSNLHGIHLRTGCSCNPGACQRFLKLSTDDVLKHFEVSTFPYQMLEELTEILTILTLCKLIQFF